MPFPLETLLDEAAGAALPLPPALEALYGGPLRFPGHTGRPYIISNFVATIDGVVALNEAGITDGGAISGFNPQDQFVMGLLRSASDAVIAGASTLRRAPGHVWTGQFVSPQQAEDYALFRSRMGKAPFPLNVVVTGSGNVDLSLPLFQDGQIPVLLLTTIEGFERLKDHPVADTVRIEARKNIRFLSVPTILETVAPFVQDGLLLIEGGPHMLGDFLSARRVDALFLTVAPQIAGRDSLVERSGLVEGKRFAPSNPLWGRLIGAKRGKDHLFLRYQF